jgi:hypothetical protein
VQRQTLHGNWRAAVKHGQENRSVTNLKHGAAQSKEACLAGSRALVELHPFVQIVLTRAELEDQD